MGMTTEHQEWRFYGRRVGRKLNPKRQEVLDNLYPKLSIDNLDKNGTQTVSSFGLTEVSKTILEIGFGNGEHLAEMMRRNPEHNFIGAEPFKNGMTAFLKEINDDDLSLSNIRVHMDDAIPLVKSLAPSSIDEIYVLNPDPWHKTRHHQRRIINQNILCDFSCLACFLDPSIAHHLRERVFERQRRCFVSQFQCFARGCIAIDY